MAEYGMLAEDDIEEGEVLFTIPRSALLHQGSTGVSALLEEGLQLNECLSRMEPVAPPPGL